MCRIAVKTPAGVIVGTLALTVRAAVGTAAADGAETGARRAVCRCGAATSRRTDADGVGLAAPGFDFFAGVGRDGPAGCDFGEVPTDDDECADPDDPLESVVSANATPGIQTIAPPIPSATANAPTRPM
jgi:hypothetical protein